MDYKNFISHLGFIPKENTSGIFEKEYTDGYAIDVDLEKKIINYGDRIKADNKTTQNFSQPENFVVLECVDRILTKGYKPENITLEKTWDTGHGTSGRLDIFVTKEDGTAYLMIECKTWGTEFDKEFKNLNKNGGQLFTYFQQDKNAEILMLYASVLEGNAIKYRNEIIKIEEDYRLAGNVVDFYEKWNKLTKNNGVWENPPYNFKPKAKTINELEDIKPEDSSFIFNRFLEILRHNVVSDKPNAFNKIFTLFLCKIYDERDKEGTDKELDFQWIEGKDNDISFQLRLTDLYKNGMKSFLEKEVTDFSDEEFENQYASLFIGNDDLKKRFKENVIYKLRLEKNNEFAIKEVYDEKSFKENAKVVKEVVELLQNYKIRYTKKQQYLSDFFELLLTTGLKQESGQFFTPVPIAQFIIKSLPIDKKVNEKLTAGQKDDLLPYVIDYASGSGHFLTESMHEIQRLLTNPNIGNLKSAAKELIAISKIQHFNWAEKYVYGVEKDYRLVKVGKVGCYLHGDGLANVIHSDGLANFKHADYKEKLKGTDKNFSQENKQFDILVSNPPYSVSAFKNAARDYYTEKDFELYNSLTDNSSEIECLFVERTKQLLKDGGVAGVILPSSILSNSGIYTKAREIILQYFDIVAITELGSNTFMATGTNTVVLFLRRRSNYTSINLRKSVDRFFTDWQDVTLNGVEKPVLKYVNHVWENVTFSDYLTFLQKTPNQIIEAHEIYKEYRNKINAKTEKDFWNTVIELEKEKLLYFILTYSQKTVLVKTGEKDAEKRFLGYEFSNRRGSEGIHPIQRGKSIDKCTKLFDENSFVNEEKASTYIYKAFSNDYEIPIHENLKENISRVCLVDMLTFDRANFEKNISTSVKKKVKIESKWNIVKIGEVVKIKNGFAFSSDEYVENGLKIIRIKNVQNGFIKDDCPVYISEDRASEFKDFVLEYDDILVSMTGNPGRVAKIKIDNLPALLNQRVGKFELINSDVLKDYFYHFINSNYFENSVVNLSKGLAQLNVSATQIESIQIPLPPKEIQEKIVAEIEVLEKEEDTKNKEIENLLKTTNQIVSDLNYPTLNLSEIVSLKNGLNYNRKSLGEIINIIGVSDFKNNLVPDLSSIEKIQIEGKLSDEYLLQPQDLLVVRSNGSANLVGRFLYIDKILPNTSFSGFTIRVRPNTEKVNSKFLFSFLRNEQVREKLTKNSSGSNIKSLNQELLSSLAIPLPPLSEQQKIVSEIEKIETQINELEQQLAEIPKQKEEILKKYL